MVSSVCFDNPDYAKSRIVTANLVSDFGQRTCAHLSSVEVFPTVDKGRKYDLQMKCAPLENLGRHDSVPIVTDHSDYDGAGIVRDSQLVVDTRNATSGIRNRRFTADDRLRSKVGVGCALK